MAECDRNREDVRPLPRRHAIEMAHEGIPLIVIQRQLGHANLGIHLDLPSGDRQRRDHRHSSRSSGADD